MIKIDWLGNYGYMFPEPGTVKIGKCGVCGSKMRVKRNVLGATCFAMAISGRKKLHDSFFCPNYNKDWHERISSLKTGVYMSLIDRRPGFKKRNRAARDEILRLLKAHKPQ